MALVRIMGRRHGAGDARNRYLGLALLGVLVVLFVGSILFVMLRH